MKKDKMKSKNTDYSCDDYDDFFEDNIAETESDYDDISDFYKVKSSTLISMEDNFAVVVLI